MRKILYAVSLLSIFALASCGQVEKPSFKQQTVDEAVAPATATPAPVEAIPSAPEQSTESSPKQSTKPVNIRPRVDIDEDNLRGFDLASEDDLYDNGMRRYMENDDEEGWY